MASKALEPLARLISVGHVSASAKQRFDRTAWEQSSIDAYNVTQQPWLFPVLTTLFGAGWGAWGVVFASPADPYVLALVGALSGAGGVLILSAVLRVAFWMVAVPQQHKEVRKRLREVTDEQAQDNERRERYHRLTLRRLREELDVMNQKCQEALAYGSSWVGQGWSAYRGQTYEGERIVDGLADRHNELFTLLKPVYRTANELLTIAGTMSSMSWKTMRTPFPVDPLVLLRQLEAEIAKAMPVLDSVISESGDAHST